MPYYARPLFQRKVREHYWQLQDMLRRPLHLKYEVKNLILKGVRYDRTIIYEKRIWARYLSSVFTRFSRISRYRKRCTITGRSFNVNHVTRYSRFVFRREAHRGSIPGIRRASF